MLIAGNLGKCRSTDTFAMSLDWGQEWNRNISEFLYGSFQAGCTKLTSQNVLMWCCRVRKSFFDHRVLNHCICIQRWPPLDLSSGIPERMGCDAWTYLQLSLPFKGSVKSVRAVSAHTHTLDVLPLSIALLMRNKQSAGFFISEGRVRAQIAYCSEVIH